MRNVRVRVALTGMVPKLVPFSDVARRLVGVFVRSSKETDSSEVIAANSPSVPLVAGPSMRMTGPICFMVTAV